VSQQVEPVRETETLLERYRRSAADEVERRLPRGEPREWLYEPMADYPRRGGKGLRAALCMATCAAFGGAESDALPAAAALELAHNAFLIHDDIQDDSLWRRGRPTLHRREGLPLALNVGDALALLSFEVLRAGGARRSARLTEELSTAMWRTLEGQAIELGWRRDGLTDLTPGDYLDLVLRKTCWYTTIAPLRMGALIGAAGPVDLAALSRFGLFLGAAFQITDDVLNVTGANAAYGKESRGDLREGKRTLMVIHLLAVARPAERDAVVAFLRPDAERTEAQIDWLGALMADRGSIAFARDFARGVADAAAASFPAAFGAAVRSDAAEMVRGLVDYVVDRAR